ncbi:cytochrome oxidase assembly protein Shy1p [Trichomonascus vanleenenianus]|uniref:cytochrome oxidase assembly protein SHY1 n=1 Tax=Trichomonascus vanleenenianus TaxID=2268995 RepID=UPI003ECA8FAA
MIARLGIARPCVRPLGALRLARTVKTSTVDWKPIRSSRGTEEGGSRAGKNFFLGLLVLMPIISFGLGTWQVRRLRWKNNVIAEAEYRLSLPPLPLPPQINPAVVQTGEFEYRRVTATGAFRHDEEMLIGPRMSEGKEGYYVVTPFERKNGSKLLIFRGWISKAHADQRTRPQGLPQGEVTIECLLRKTPQKNMFTPEDDPEHKMYHFMSIDTMAENTNSQPIYIQELLNFEHGGYELMEEQMVRRGIPIGTPGKIDIRNSHFQYILTWYGLCAFTTVMLFKLLRQGRSPNSALAKKLQHARDLDR